MNKLFIIIHLLILGCMPISLNGYQYEEQDKLVQDIISKASKKFEKKYEMDAIGIGTGMPSGVIHLLAINFEKTGPLSKEMGRKIVVECVEDLLDMVNNNEKIRPFLKDFPFTSKNIEIALFVKDKSHRDIYGANYGIVSASRGNIKFLFSSTEPPHLYCKKETESFAEALKKVQESHSKEISYDKRIKRGDTETQRRGVD